MPYFLKALKMQDGNTLSRHKSRRNDFYQRTHFYSNKKIKFREKWGDKLKFKI